MPKKQSENPSSLISLMVDHARSTSGPPFSLEGLPGEAWKCLCLVAWKRLERSNPRWADIIKGELGNFRTTWNLSGYWCRKDYLGDKAILSRHGGNVGDAWLVEAFQSMLDTTLKKGQQPLDNPRSILAQYDELLSVVKDLKKTAKAIRNVCLAEQFWRKELQEILNQRPYRYDTDAPTDCWRTATVTSKMIRIALDKSPSAVVLEILYHLYNYSPSTLKKKLLPLLRKTPIPPTEFWREKLLKAPR